MQSARFTPPPSPGLLTVDPDRPDDADDLDLSAARADDRALIRVVDLDDSSPAHLVVDVTRDAASDHLGVGVGADVEIDGARHADHTNSASAQVGNGQRQPTGEAAHARLA